MFNRKQILKILITPIVGVMLFTLTGISLAGMTVPLIAAQHYNIGEVVINDSDPLNVQITYRVTASDYWCLQFVHADIQAVYADFPMTKKENPKVGHFVVNEGVACASEATFSLGPQPPDATYVVAAQADVDNTPYCLAFAPLCDAYIAEGAWGEGELFGGRNWAMYFSVTGGVEAEADLALESLDVPVEVTEGETRDLLVRTCNNDIDMDPPTVKGVVTLEGVSLVPEVLPVAYAETIDLALGSCVDSIFSWTAPDVSTKITWTAEVEPVGVVDPDMSNNSATDATTVYPVDRIADLVLDELVVPSVVLGGGDRVIPVSATVCNLGPSIASGWVDLVGVSRVVYDPPIPDATFSGTVNDLVSDACQTVDFTWIVDDRGTTMDWTVTVTPFSGSIDPDLGNNTATDLTLVYPVR